MSRPPACSTRLHCTMIRHDDENNLSSGTCYTLYLEYLGGLVPLLKGKRTSKIRPEFVIFDPQSDGTVKPRVTSQRSRITLTNLSSVDSGVFLPYSDSVGTKSSSASSHSTINTNGRTDSSDSDIEDGCKGSPRLSRKRKQRSKQRHHSSSDKSTNDGAAANDVPDELAYVDTLPEEVKLVEVNSNIWGTKFKIHGIAKNVPANLGQISYKTSLLHLQPRQMTVVVTELRDDFPGGPDPNFNPNIFSEDEEEHHQSAAATAQKRLNDNASPIAPMSPRPSRFSTRNRSSTPSRLSEKQSGIGPLAKAESYEDDVSYVEFPDAQSHAQARPKTIDTSYTSSSSSSNQSRPGPSYTSLVTQYSRSSSNSSGQSRHAISPLCCDGSVPTLQSPKNAVAPSDIIFDRPPASVQTTVMSYSSNTDYAANVVQVKNALISDQPRTNSHVNPVPLNLSLNLERIDLKSAKEKFSNKKKDLQYIDEDTPTTSTAPPPPMDESKMRRVPTVMSISPACLVESITRSCSVGYLDSVEITPSDDALSMLRKEAPNKRLVLVDRKPNKKNRKHTEAMKKQKLQQCGKSKSLDSCDLLQALSKQNNNDITDLMPKLAEAPSESECAPTDLVTVIVETNSSNRGTPTKTPSSSRDTSSKSNGKDKTGICSTCRQPIATDCFCKSFKKIQPNTTSCNSVDTQNNNNTNYYDLIISATMSPSKRAKTKSRGSIEQIFGDASNRPSCSKNNNKTEYVGTLPPMPKANRKKSEVITSYTDSPLFSRKHRFGEEASSSRYSESSRSPILGKKCENTFSFIKQLSEARRKRKEESAQRSAKTEPEVQQQVEATPVEQKTSVSLHTQVSGKALGSIIYILFVCGFLF